MILGSHSSKARILFLSHRLPWPPHNGAALRTYNLIRVLAPAAELELLCFERPDPHTRHYRLPDRVAEMSKLGRVSVFPIPQLDSRPRLLLDHLRSTATGRPYTWYMHDSKAFEEALEEKLRGHWDLICVDSLDLVRWLPRVLAVAPVVLTHHNVESDLLRLRAASAPRAQEAYLRYQAGRLLSAEHQWLERVALNIAVSDDDRQKLQRISPVARIVTIPNGVDVNYFQPGEKEPVGQSCVFVGGATWYPNLDGMRWFCAEVLPLLRPRVRVAWVGRMSDRHAHEFRGVDGLDVLGYVDDIRPVVAQARCFIAPLRVGSGTRLKLLDAWAMGKAIVTTTIAAEGLGAVDGLNSLVADDPRSFADQVLRLMGDDALRSDLEERGRAHAVEHYSWDSIGERWLDALESVMAGRQTEPA